MKQILLPCFMQPAILITGTVGRKGLNRSKRLIIFYQGWACGAAVYLKAGMQLFTPAAILIALSELNSAKRMKRKKVRLTFFLKKPVKIKQGLHLIITLRKML